MIQYQVVSSTDLGTLEKAVTELLNQGWTYAGNFL